MKKNYLFLIIIGIIVTVSLSIAAFNSFQQLIKTIITGRDLRTQKQDLILLLSNVKDAETGQRGYVITGNEDYLGPYYTSLQTIDESLRVLQKNLISPQQKPFLDQLSQAIRLKLVELQDVIYIQRTKGFEAAKKKVMDNEGKERMDEIRTSMDHLLYNQNEAVENNAQNVEVLIQKSFLLNLLGGLISSLLICLFSLMFYRDSVELTKVKKQFRQTNDLYKAILDSAKQMIITTNTAGLVTSFNKGAEKILGYKAEDMTNKISILDFYDRSALRNKAEELTGKQKHVQYNEFEALVASSRHLIWIDSEWPMKKKNGNLFSSSQTITALRDEANTITGYLIIGSDVSDQKKWEQELKEAQAAIEMAQLSKDRFLASFNHEFRVPLNTIMKFSTLLMKNVGNNLTDLEIAYATRIKDNCQAMLNLMNEIIDISKGKGSLPSHTFQPIKLDRFIKKIIDEIGSIQNIQFLLEIPKDIQPLETDSETFNTLVKHLLWHATHQYQGQITIRVKTDLYTLKPLEMEIIQNEVKTAAAVSASMEAQEESMDLTIAESLASRLGYEIKKLTRWGKGIVYSLRFNQPKQMGGFLKADRENPTSSEQEEESALGGNNSNFTILIADDDPDFRSTLTSYLEDLGCRVIPAANGAEAIQLAKSNSVDLITMEMMMSPMNGYEIIQQLQRDPNLKRIPYAFISIIAKDVQSKIPGALAFINKPITRDDIVRLLQIYQDQR